MRLLMCEACLGTGVDGIYGPKVNAE